MDIRRIGRLTRIIFIVGVLGVFSAIAIAQTYNFAGTWKGVYTAAPPTAGAPAATSAPATTGRPGGGGGGGGGFGASSGPQKITLRVKVNKEKDKATGNFTMGSSPEDIREGRIAGNKLTFKTGLAPAAIYDYDAVLIGEDLSVTRTAEGKTAGKPQLFTLKISK